MRNATAIAVVLCMVTGPLFAAGGSSVPDENTMGLFHLDGNAKDASATAGRSRVLGEVSYEPGKFGQALKLDSKGAVTVHSSRSLQVGDKSWTIECWVKPRPGQKDMAVVASVPGLGRSAGIRMYPRRVGGFFSATERRTANLRSKDLGNQLFDGQWHHLAVVRDQERNGEVRLYVDFEHVSERQVAMGLPIITSRRAMPLTIGALAPWTLGKRSFIGLIDEVRVSDVVRPEFAAGANAPKAPPKVERQPIPGAAVSPDAPESRTPLRMTPGNTIILTSGFLTSVEDAAAARLLQKWLRLAADSETGFDIASDDKTTLRKGMLGIAVGQSGYVTEEALEPLDAHAVVLRRKGNVVCVFGGSPEATTWAAVRFLDEFAGVRFYMPGDLFTGTPAKLDTVIEGVDRTIEPYVRSCTASGFHNDYLLETPWCQCNAMTRPRGRSHQHNFMQRFDPAIYGKTHPEIYPILKGQRHIPTDRRDNRWQPCFTEPKLVEVAVDSTIRYFRQHPGHVFIGFSVMDSHSFCECPRCSEGMADALEALKKEQPDARRRLMFAQRQIHSPHYWRFMNKLAARLDAALPAAGIKGKKLIVGLVYSAARGEIDFKLHPDICTWFVFKWSDGFIDKLLLPDGKGGYTLARMQTWLEKSNHIGHHDWAHGKGLLIPRINTGLTSIFFKLFKEHDLVFTHTECYPNWGLDGPKLFIHSRIWWDPEVDVTALWRQFCDDMFGPAANEMLAYFMGQEALWINLETMNERKLNRYTNQFDTTPEHRKAIAALRANLTQAAALAETEEQKQRIALFSKTFKLSEMLFALAAAETITPQMKAKIVDYTRDVIQPDPMTIYRMRNQKDYVVKVVENAVKAVHNEHRKRARARRK